MKKLGLIGGVGPESTIPYYSGNNLNQLTRRAHETGRIYDADLEDIRQNQERIWTAAERIVSSLAMLK